MQHLDEGTIHAWLDGALNAEESRQAEAHVAACGECADAVAEARGLIAASSMILSKLDYASSARGTAVNDVRPPRAQPQIQARARRQWLQDARVRAAAAILILAGGAAGVSGVTGRDELAGVIDGAATESAALSSEPAPVPASESLGVAAGDATAAPVAQSAAVAPPPTVGPAPHLPRPQPAAGPRATAAPQAPSTGRFSSGAEMAAAGVAAGVESAAPAAPPVPSRTAPEERAEASSGVQRAAVAVAPPATVTAPSPLVGDVSGTLRGVETARDAAAGEAGPARQAVPPPPAQVGAPFADSIRARLARESQRRAVTGSRGQPNTAMALAPSASGAGSAARCYVLTLSPWSPANDPLPAAPPTRIVLSPDTAASGLAKGQRLVRPMAGTAEGPYDAAWWTEVSPSTLVLTWATPREGIVMRLVRSGPDVSGTARTFGSEAGVERASTVTGQLVECDTPR